VTIFMVARTQIPIIMANNYMCVDIKYELDIARELCAIRQPKPADCHGQPNGVAVLSNGLSVVCDGGALVMQRRYRPYALTMDRDWSDYRGGFGSLSGELWLGLQHVYGIVCLDWKQTSENIFCSNIVNTIPLSIMHTCARA
jgi:hypothetical protein